MSVARPCSGPVGVVVVLVGRIETFDITGSHRRKQLWLDSVCVDDLRLGLRGQHERSDRESGALETRHELSFGWAKMIH